MSNAMPTEPGSTVRPDDGAATDLAASNGTGDCSVRRARPEDLKIAAQAVAALLVELGGTPPAMEAMEAATKQLIEDEGAGLLLLAEQDGELVGVLAASWQLAIHTAGRYALLQDLWVKPEHRSSSIGRQMLEALCVRTRELGMPRVEVGLPSESFPHLEATRAFYTRNGFKPLGPRMRRVLT
jgi:GNAT superfamily N-acetyltransferase